MDFSHAERLAALLDGNCTAEERAELLAQLAASEEDLEVFSYAAAVMDENEEKRDTTRVIRFPDPETRRDRPRWRPPRILALAAGIVALAIGVGVWRIATRAPGGPASMAASLGNVQAAVAQVDPLALRGTMSLPHDQRAVRAGATLLRLQLQANAGDAEGARATAAEVSAIVRAAHFGDDLADRYAAFARDGGSSGGMAGTLDDMGREVEHLLGKDATRLGEWLMAAQIAATTQNREFLRSEESRARLEGRRDGTLLRPAAADIGQARAAAAADPPDWPVLHGALTRALVRLAG